MGVKEGVLRRDFEGKGFSADFVPIFLRLRAVKVGYEGFREM